MKVIAHLLLYLISCQAIGQVNQDDLLAAMHSKMDSLPNGCAFSVAVLKDDRVYFIGMVKNENELQQVELQDSLFEIGSLTKVFTSTLLAHQVIHDRLKLTESVQKVFPFKFNGKLKFNYQQLANHTSGLYRLPSNILPLLVQNQNNPYAAYSTELFDQYLEHELQIEQTEEPKYVYSNLGAGLLACALSKRSKQPFDDLLQKHLFEVYRMPQTDFDVRTSFVGINPQGEPAENWQFNALKGAGGLISSTGDLAQFVAAQFDTNNRVLALTRKSSFSISDKMSIGLGWHILNPNSTDLKYWHNGGTGGFTSSISFRTDNKTGVIILSNLSAMHAQSKLVDELCFELLDLIR